jgi:23S rRNA pseudouridine2604 synthase
MLTQSSIRLNKYISDSGICSRRSADRHIKQGNVFINGNVAAVAAQVFVGDVVQVNGQRIEPRNAEDFGAYRAEQAGGHHHQHGKARAK